MECIFCNIAHKKILSDYIYEDDNVIVIDDINPQAPVHFLVIPKEHIESIDKISIDNSAIVAKVFEVIAQLTRGYGLDESGYRVIANYGLEGGQTVNHLHFHVLGGRKLIWPPG